MKIFLISMGIVIFVVLIGLYGMMVFRDITYTQNCGGYLKRAADANTVELAKKSLGTAIEYAKDHNLTKGYTSIIYKTPDEDIGFWFTNLSASLEELKNISPGASKLEKTNVLMKLRETLLDNDKDGTSITEPEGISLYPHNKTFFWLQIILWILFGIIFVAVLYDHLM